MLVQSLPMPPHVLHPLTNENSLLCVHGVGIKTGDLALHPGVVIERILGHAGNVVVGVAVQQQAVRTPQGADKRVGPDFSGLFVDPFL